MGAWQQKHRNWWQAVPNSWQHPHPQVVRSHSGEIDRLLLLLRSVELFWPIGLWGVVVILDDDPFDAAVAALLPAYVKVVLEPPPPFWDDYVAVPRKLNGTDANARGAGSGSKGYVRSQWSQFVADLYSSADFIAWIDTDCVLYTYITPSILFDFVNGTYDTSSMPWRPVIAGMDKPVMYFPVIAILGWPWVCEFMVGFPFVLRRDLFPLARKVIVQTMEGQMGQSSPTMVDDSRDAPSHEEFGAAFLLLGQKVSETFQGRGVDDGRLLPSAPAILGHVAYLFAKSAYTFSIHTGSLLAHAGGARDNWPHENLWKLFPMRVGPEGLLAQDRCPALRGVVHLGYWSEYDKTTSSKEYFKLGVHLMLLGRCGDITWPKSHLGGHMGRALCIPSYCLHCLTLQHMLQMAHDGYKIFWGKLPLAGCPPRRNMDVLLSRYKREWVAISSSMLRGSEFSEDSRGVPSGGTLDFAGPLESVTAALSLQESYLALLMPRPGGI